jgi:hypothetical protein
VHALHELAHVTYRDWIVLNVRRHNVRGELDKLILFHIRLLQEESRVAVDK